MARIGLLVGLLLGACAVDAPAQAAPRSEVAAALLVRTDSVLQAPGPAMGSQTVLDVRARPRVHLSRERGPDLAQTVGLALGGTLAFLAWHDCEGVPCLMGPPLGFALGYAGGVTVVTVAGLVLKPG